MKAKVPKVDKTTKIMAWVTAMIIILVAGGVAAVILNNRFQTERDNALAQQKAKQEQQAANQKKQQQFTNGLGLITCKADADKAYWSYVGLNATDSTQGADGSIIYTAPQSTWSTANDQKQQAYNDCYRQYPSNQ